MRTSIHNILMLSILLILTACGGSDVVSYVPFQEEEDGKWGLLGSDGTVLVSEEFTNMPTAVHDGCFWVKNRRGMWEAYRIEDAEKGKIKQIGDEYKTATDFCCGRALVSAPNEPISIIDHDGKVVKVIDQIDGHNVEYATAFDGKYSVFVTSDDCYGVIDNNGDVVIEPKYSVVESTGEGKGEFMAVDEKYRDNFANAVVKVINADEDVLGSVKHAKYDDMRFVYKEGCFVVGKKSRDVVNYGLLQLNGEFRVVPAKHCTDIRQVCPTMYVWEKDGGHYGVRDYEDNDILRAHYENIYILDGEESFMVHDDDEWMMVDREENQIGKETFEDWSILDAEGHVYGVETKSDRWQLMDGKGNIIELPKDAPRRIYHIGSSSESADSFAQSDYLDTADVIKNLGVKGNGIGGVTLSQGTESLVAFFSQKNGEALSSPEDYLSVDKMTYDTEVYGADVTISCYYPRGYIGKEAYRTETRTDWWFGEEEVRVHDGYRWSDEKYQLKCEVNIEGKLADKGQQLFDAISDYVIRFGSADSDNSGAHKTVVNASAGHTITVVADDDYETIVIYYDPASLSEVEEAVEAVEEAVEAVE